VERTFALLVGALGILKAGAAYVPLDWTYPAERLRFMLEDTAAPILVTQSSMLGYLPSTEGKSVCLDKDWEHIAACSTENPTPSAKATDLAYIMYTSGSTGRAKGVGLAHRGAVSFAHWAREAFSPEELARVLASTSICFDLSIFEIFVPLSWGGTVILAENAAELPALPSERSITLINTVPSAIKDLLTTGKLPSSVSVVNLAGEKLTTSTTSTDPRKRRLMRPGRCAALTARQPSVVRWPTLKSTFSTAKCSPCLLESSVRFSSAGIAWRADTSIVRN
jgi:non-ribosomal peptide synthetase component F